MKSPPSITLAPKVMMASKKVAGGRERPKERLGVSKMEFINGERFGATPRILSTSWVGE